MDYNNLLEAGLVLASARHIYLPPNNLELRNPTKLVGRSHVLYGKAPEGVFPEASCIAKSHTL